MRVSVLKCKRCSIIRMEGDLYKGDEDPEKALTKLHKYKRHLREEQDKVDWYIEMVGRVAIRQLRKGVSDEDTLR